MQPSRDDAKRFSYAAEEAIARVRDARFMYRGGIASVASDSTQSKSVHIVCLLIAYEINQV
jgi:hypothetical protein